jgi:hypothetical protein
VGTLTEARAAARMLEVVRDHDIEQTQLEADDEERGRRGVTFRAGAEWMPYLEHEKGAKPSTLRDYRWLLAEPGQAHGRGSGRAPGLMMSAFGDRPARELTTRDVAEYLRGPRSSRRHGSHVNKHRQVISAAFNFAMREDTYRVTSSWSESQRRSRERAVGRAGCEATFSPRERPRLSTGPFPRCHAHRGVKRRRGRRACRRAAK